MSVEPDTDGVWGRVERRDAELWYYDSGEHLPVVVLLHGLAGYALEWGPILQVLQDDYTVISLEQRGHGSSTRRPTDVSRQAYVDDVVAVLDELAVDEVTVVGQSMGGHTAMLLAAQRPDLVARLVMIEAGLGGGGDIEWEGVVSWLRGWPAPFPDRDAFLSFFGGDRMVAEAWADGLDLRADGLWPQWDADTLGRALAPVLEREFQEEWEQVGAPTLLIRGEFGSIPERQVETMCALRPETRAVRVARAGHDVHLEAPEACLKLLSDFMTD